MNPIRIKPKPIKQPLIKSGGGRPERFVKKRQLYRLYKSFWIPLDANPPKNALKKGWCGFLRQPLPHGECRRRQAHDKFQALNE